jgi:hypothetical protein
VTTTHAPLAEKVQRKMRNGVAQLAAAGSSWIGRKVSISATRPADERPRNKPVRPQAAPSAAAAQTRIVSMTQFGLRENLLDLSKG